MKVGFIHWCRLPYLNPTTWKIHFNRFLFSSFPLGCKPHSNDLCVCVCVSTQLSSGITLCPGHTQWTWHSRHLFHDSRPPFTLSSLSVSSFLFIALQILYSLTVFFFLSLSSKLPCSSLDKNVDKSPWKIKQNKNPSKIEIMAYIKLARGANQRSSWENHSGTEVAVVMELLVGGKPGPLYQGD